MSQGVTFAVAALAIVCAVLLGLDLIRGRRRRGAIGLLLLAAFLVVLYITTGFPAPSSGRVSFGGTISVWWAVLGMFAGVILGMIAQYLWTKPENFTWLDIVRPIVISPMVLLPLVGSLSSGPLEAIQLLSMVLLAFQNGYFWQQVLKDAKPSGA